ncbi:MAG: hypothetical protein ABTQ32_11195 [Myxococcaceae bacterium]
MCSGLLAEDGVFETLHATLERLRDAVFSHRLDERSGERILASLNGLNRNRDFVEALFHFSSEFAEVIGNRVDATRILIELPLDDVEALVVFIEAFVMRIEALVVRVEPPVVLLGLLLEEREPFRIRLVHLPGPHQE